MKRETWKNEPEEHDFPAAGNYLALLAPAHEVSALVAALQVADGYHRVCASYHLDENADIPCKLIDLT